MSNINTRTIQRKPKTKHFSFDKNFLGNKLSFDYYFNTGYGSKVWSPDITKSQMKQVIEILKEAFEDNVVYYSKQFLPHKNVCATTYTKYDKFKWICNKFDGNYISCTYTMLAIYDGGVFIEKNPSTIEPELNVKLIDSLDAMYEIREKISKIAKLVVGYEEVFAR